LTRKVGQNDLVFSYQSSLVGLCAHDYKSLWVAVTICTTLVNTQKHTATHRQTENTLTSLYEQLSQMS